MKAVNLRELKNRLGGYVREVRAGEVILVTDRGEVVAELRPPLFERPAVTTRERALERLASEGKVRLGVASDEPYPAPPRRVRAGAAARLLDEDRGER